MYPDPAPTARAGDIAPRERKPRRGRPARLRLFVFKRLTLASLSPADDVISLSRRNGLESQGSFTLFTASCSLDRFANLVQARLLNRLRSVPPPEIDLMESIEQERRFARHHLHRNDRDMAWIAGV